MSAGRAARVLKDAARAELGGILAPRLRALPDEKKRRLIPMREALEGVARGIGVAFDVPEGVRPKKIVCRELDCGRVVLVAARGAIPKFCTEHARARAARSRRTHRENNRDRENEKQRATRCERERKFRARNPEKEREHKRKYRERKREEDRQWRDRLEKWSGAAS